MNLLEMHNNNKTKIEQEQSLTKALELKEEKIQELQQELKAAYTKIESLANSDILLQQAQQLEQSAKEQSASAEKLMSEQESLQKKNAEKETKLQLLQEELNRKEKQLEQTVAALRTKAQKDAETALAAQAYELGQREKAVSNRENRIEQTLKKYKEQAKRDAENSIKDQQTNIDKEWSKLEQAKESYKTELKNQSLEKLSEYKLVIFSCLIITGTILAAEIAQSFDVYKYIGRDIWQLLTHFLDTFWEPGELWWRMITTIWTAFSRWAVLYLAVWGLIKTKIYDWDGLLFMVLRLVPIILLTIAAWKLGERETANYIEYLCLIYGIVRLYRKVKADLHKES